MVVESSIKPVESGEIALIFTIVGAALLSVIIAVVIIWMWQRHKPIRTSLSWISSSVESGDSGERIVAEEQLVGGPQIQNLQRTLNNPICIFKSNVSGPAVIQSVAGVSFIPVVQMTIDPIEDRDLSSTATEVSTCQKEFCLGHSSGSLVCPGGSAKPDFPEDIAMMMLADSFRSDSTNTTQGKTGWVPQQLSLTLGQPRLVWSAIKWQSNPIQKHKFATITTTIEVDLIQSDPGDKDSL